MAGLTHSIQMLPFVGGRIYVGFLLILGLLVVDGVEGFSIDLGRPVARDSVTRIRMTTPSGEPPDNDGASRISSRNASWDRRRWIQSAAAGGAYVAVAGAIMTGNPSPSNAGYIDVRTDMPKITHTVYLDVQIMSATNTAENEQAEPPTRIMIGLFGDVMPKTVENFVALCEGTNGGSLSYAGTTFYRVLSGLTVQGGAIGPNTKSGKTGLSSFSNGDPFEPDNYNIQHSHSDGLVCMVRGLGGSVDSRFFIHTNADGGWANDRYAAFGMVLNEDGLDFIHKKMDKVEVKPPSNIPVTPIQIVASGVLTTPQA